MRRNVLMFFFLMGIVLVHPGFSYAATQTGTIPFLDNVMMTIKDDFTGFWAYTITTLGVVFAGVKYAMTGSLETIGRVVFGGAIMLGSVQIIGFLYSGSGALVP